jgi:hypothetical protein
VEAMFPTNNDKHKRKILILTLINMQVNTITTKTYSVLLSIIKIIFIIIISSSLVITIKFFVCRLPNNQMAIYNISKVCGANQVKVEGKVVPCAQLIKQYTTKTYRRADAQIHIFLTSALAGGEWSPSRPCRFTPSTHWIGCWVGPRASLDGAN